MVLSPGSSPALTAANPANPVQNAPQRRTRRTLRIRVACLRCQRRKIRCDGAVPSCGSCSKTGVECIDGGKFDGIESPRAYISSLERQVQWLKSVVRANCPDIDLEQGPPVMNESGQDDPVTERESSQDGLSLDHPNPTPGNGSTPAPSNPSAPGQNVQSIRDISTVQHEQQTGLAHEIGLVSSCAGADPKYIGPSSGYFFAKLVLACAQQGKRDPPPKELQQSAKSRTASLLPKGGLSIPPTPLPSDMDYAVKISEAYFETIHPQYPFLHQPSYMKLIEHVYAELEPNPTAAFQVYLVLALGATVLSRRLKIPLSGEGFCASAMKYFDKLCIENSLKGLQSLLLLLVYTLNSPSMGLNVWYLNYQCIAALLDLGLQRDVKSGKTMSVLDQELRTRAFWVIYSLDRSVATMMGRPIGLRDEACELRLPTDVEDGKLTATGIQPRLENEQPTQMSSAIHLFKLARLNSEIKYVLHSISHEVPPYAYPRIPDVLQWQRGIMARLQAWLTQIPQFTGERIYMTHLCEIKYHGVMMLLLRPSPAIPNPSVNSLKSCYESAVASIRLYNQLYKRDLLVYSWVTVHSVFLSTITMLHCIWTVPEVSAQIKLEILMADLKAGSNVLSATGEHWSEAKRSRDVLDELSGTTIRWIIESRARNSEIGTRSAISTKDVGSSNDNNSLSKAQPATLSLQQNENSTLWNDGQDQQISFNQSQSLDLNADGQSFEPSFYASLFGSGTLTDQIDFTNPAAVNAIMHGVFTGFQPIYDFEQDFGGDQIIGGQL
ncbi:hypothetical protein GGI43DRAFT_277865 [Trichoderma evansii]